MIDSPWQIHRNTDESQTRTHCPVFIEAHLHRSSQIPHPTESIVEDVS